MGRVVDYYFAVYSPWSYLGHETFMTIAARRGVEVRYRPTPLLDLFRDTGGAPLSQRPPSRQRYRWMELQRWRAARGVELNLKPKFWPYRGDLPERTVVALTLAERDPDPFLRRAFAGVWREERDLGEEATVAGLLEEAGEDAAAILERAASPLAEALFAENRGHAVAAGVFGAPSYVLDGEVFWGQDRLDMLDEALRSGRKPFLPL